MNEHRGSTPQSPPPPDPPPTPQWAAGSDHSRRSPFASPVAIVVYVVLALALLAIAGLVVLVAADPEESGGGSSEAEEADGPVDAEAAFVDLGAGYRYAALTRRQERVAVQRFRAQLPPEMESPDVDVVNVVDTSTKSVTGAVVAAAVDPELAEDPTFREGVFRGFAQEAGSVESTDIGGQRLVVGNTPQASVAGFFNRDDVFVTVVGSTETVATDLATQLIEGS